MKLYRVFSSKRLGEEAPTSAVIIANTKVEALSIANKEFADCNAPGSWEVLEIIYKNTNRSRVISYN